MVISAWVFVVKAESWPRYARESILTRGDNQSAVHWVNQRRGSLVAAHLRVCLDGLETRSRWCFTAAHVAAVAITLAGGISRWNRESINANLCEFRPGVLWYEQVLRRAGVDLCFEILAESTVACQLRPHLDGHTRAVFGRGIYFAL